MRPTISEFSYGYAVTDKLIHGQGAKVVAAPVFPSLYQEGQSGGGYDLKLQRPGIPLFLQFKLSDCMVRDTAFEAQEGLLTVPFYRMHLRPSRHSDQHQMLIELEHAGNEVFYCAPDFHTPPELDLAYLQNTVRERSLWLWPSLIGQLPDRSNHHVSFKNVTANYFYFCSEPEVFKADASFANFNKRIERQIVKSGNEALKPDSLSEIIDVMEEIAMLQSQRGYFDEKLAQAQDKLTQLAKIAYYAQVFFQAQFFIAHLAEDKAVESS